MSHVKVKIETLTPVHIGSGNLLRNNADFIIDEDLVVLSDEKIWKLLESDEKHMKDWLAAIADKNIYEFLKRFPEVKSKDYAKRIIPLKDKIKKGDTLKKSDTLKECIHNGMGLPYIPGSSLKGAIRTAIFASRTDEVSDKENKIKNSKKKAAIIEKELFGRDSFSDIFRFFLVGDAYFDKGTEIATRLVNLNIRDSKDSLWDFSKSQIVEAIDAGTKSEFTLKISKEHYDFVKNNFYHLGNLPETASSINDLFGLINEHTLKLAEKEIVFFNDPNKFGKKTGGDDYVKKMENILQKINECENGKSCILRIGHASGWRFITGAWTEDLSDFPNIVLPNYRRKIYEKYVFPKTRRLDEDSDIFGFVKLSI